MKSADRWCRVLCLSVMALGLVLAGCATDDDGSPADPYAGFGGMPWGGAGGDPIAASGGDGVAPTGGGYAPTGGGYVPGGGAGGSTPPPATGGGIDWNPDEMEYDPECAGSIIDPVPIEMQVEVQVPEVVTTPAPISLYIMLDQSSSMVDNTTSPRKWETAREALKAFVADPASTHMNVALQFFPLVNGQCNGTGYSTPAVNMLALPDTGNVIPGLLDATPEPAGISFTPLEGALRGVTGFCQQYQQSTEGMSCVAVLITDGEPTECAGSVFDPAPDPTALYNIADQAYEQFGVKTFAVGMQGARFDILDQIAMRGATDCDGNPNNGSYACDVRPGSGMTLVQAFEAIREFVTEVQETTEFRTEYEKRISQCEWGLPEPAPGEIFDPTKVQVVLLTDENFDEGGEPLPRLDGGDCGASGSDNVWVYDDPTGFNPTKALLCPQTCAKVTSMVGATMQIRVGCKSPVQ